MYTNKFYIIDFEDSFTFNIASELSQFCNNIEVVNYKIFFDLNLKLMPNTGIILGPGPGHPKDYHGQYQKIQLLLDNENVKIMGICLGHQIICDLMGFTIKSSSSIKHGESIIVDIFGRAENVQRYNSLAVYDFNNLVEKKFRKYSFHQNELIYGENDQLISYQFHPESIGTEHPAIFFQQYLKFFS